MELANEKGALYHALSHFIFNGINLSRIESRPMKDRAWEYRFFIDLEGNLQEEDVLHAIRGLQEETNKLRILGNY
jgi:chorismate mutase/prephenate dehydratase